MKFFAQKPKPTLAVSTYVERNVQVLYLPDMLGTRIMIRVDQMHPNHLYLAQLNDRMLKVLQDIMAEERDCFDPTDTEPDSLAGRARSVIALAEGRSP